MDYLQYWKPRRSALAFGETADPIRSLANGWFSNLKPDDRLWILTSQGSRLVLALRAIVSEGPVLLRRPPPYAVGNSRGFRNFEVEFAKPHVAARAIPFPMSALRKMRFTSTSSTLTGPLNKILTGPLSAKKPLQPRSVELLESIWSHGSGHSWTEISVRQGGQTVFTTAEHRDRVERAAIQAVTSHFERRGWKVESRELDGVGYDLDCHKAGRTLHVEVKGTAGSSSTFFLTAREHRVMHSDRQFRLAVVTLALSEGRKITIFTPSEARSQFEFSALAYAAIPKK